MKIEIISADGTYLINDKHRDARSVVMASGDFGSATAVLAYKTLDGAYVDFKDSELVSGDQVIVTHGLDIGMYVKVEGSTASTNIEFKCTSVD